jgi:Viral BACON domain
MSPMRRLCSEFCSRTALLSRTGSPHPLCAGSPNGRSIGGLVVFLTAILFVALVAGAQAQQFQNIPALKFTMPLASGNPLPQVVAVASRGANFKYSASASTTSGGNWLTVSPAGCCVATPTVETVSVVNTASLAVGSYNGQITFQSQDLTRKLVVPVTLMVEAKNTAFFDSVPGQLSFAMKRSGTLAPQTFQIRNGGAGTLNWTLTTSTSDGGNWLTASATSGTAPSLVTIGVNTGSLPGGGATTGNFGGQAQLHSAQGDVTVPISVTVNNNGFEQLNPISFVMVSGSGNPLPQLLAVASTGTAFNYSAGVVTSQGGNWLTVSPAGCCVSTPTVETISVINAASLPVGGYSGQVTFRAQDGSKAVTVPVTLTVAAANTAFFDSVPGHLSFAMPVNGNTPPAQSFEIHNGGTGALNWTLTTTTADGGDWLNVSAASGTAPSLLAVSIDPSQLPSAATLAATYNGQILLHSPLGDATVPVTVTVNNSGFEQLNPISFVMPQGGGNPLPQLLAVASTGTAFNYSAAAVTSRGGSWLTVSPAGCCPTTPTIETVSVINASTLAAGSYSGEVTFRTQDGSKAIVVPVTLTVAAANTAFFDSVPGQLSFSMTAGGRAPQQQIFPIRDGGTGTLNWALTASTADGGAWLTVSATIGTAPSRIAVGIDPTQLPSGGTLGGTFNGQLFLHSNQGDVTVPVSVTVDNNGFEQLNPISFSMVAGGGNPLPQIVSVASTGTNFNYSAVAVASQGGNWLTVSPAGCCPTTPTIVNVNVINASALAAGVYSGEVTFRAQTGTKAITVPVTLTVHAANTAFIDSIPGQLSFTLPVGGAAPPPQTFAVRNGGTGTLNSTLTTSTADGGAWLKATPAQGASPKTITVNVVPANLPNAATLAGTFNGQILLHSATGDATVPVTVTVDDNGFTQVNPINFTMPAGGNNPLPQILAVASTGTAFNYSAAVATAKGGNWLTISPAGCCPTTPVIEIASVVNAATLAAGSYSGQVMFRAQNGSKAITVPVTLTVEAANTPFFGGMQGLASFFLTPNSGSNPPSQTVQVLNGGTGTLNWTRSITTADGGSWLHLTPASGTAPSTATVSITTTNLPDQGTLAGTFVGEGVFQAPTGNVTIPVIVTVADPVFEPIGALHFTATVGSNPPSKMVTVSSTGTAFNYSAAAATSKGGNWLTVSPAGCCPTTPRVETVAVNSSALAAGTYVGQVTFRTQDGTKALVVPVVLTVNP